MALSPTDRPVLIQDGVNSGDTEMEPLAPSDPDDPNKPAHFDYITENVYISASLQTSKDRKRSKRMVCECQFDAESDEPDEACGENCLNRLLMIECGSRCPCGEYCTNKKFQRAEYAQVEVFKTDKKGWGLRALKPIPAGTFIMEYCGEVCTSSDFEQRKIEYVKEKRRHYYFMSLTADEILDATRRGNLSRYINHSCDPNSETQKWTVNGKLRIGFFSVKDVEVNEELTFDYKFQRFGDVAQKCYCGSANCRGYLGQTKQAPATLKVVNLDHELGSPRSPSSSRRRPRQRIQSDADSAFEKDLYDIVGSSWRLKSNNQVLAFCRLMLQAESPSQRIMLLQVLQATDDIFSKKFISFHGLRLLWSWMVDLPDMDSPERLQFRIQVLQTLGHLPIATKNQLDDNKILPVVRRWVEHSHRGKQSSGEESVSSQQQPSSSDEQLEGTIVTEADSVCEPAPEQEVGGVREEGDTLTEEGEGSSEAEAREPDSVSEPTPVPEVEGGVARDTEEEVKEDEGASREAEAREQSASDQSQDEGQTCEAREKLTVAAEELLKKWEVLKEVFRIPKRTPQRTTKSPSGEEESKESEEMDEEDVIPSRKGRHRDRERHTSSHYSSPRDRRPERPSDNQPDRTWSRRKGLLPTPKRPSRTSSPSQRIPTNPPTTTPPINPTLSFTLPSTVAGYPGSHTHTYTTSFTGAAPVQNTVIVQQPGQSVYVQQQVFQDGLKTTILPTQYAPPIQRQPQPTAQQYVQVNPAHLPSLPPLPATTYTQLTQQAPGGGLIQNPPVPIPTAVAPPTGFVPAPSQAAVGSTNVATLQPQYFQQAHHQHQHPQLYLQSSASGSLMTGTSLLPQQQTSSPAGGNPLTLAPLPPPPPDEEKDLPINWKTARDSNGKVYYYHSITRKTQWERPTERDVEGTITMDLGTPESESDGDLPVREKSAGPRGPRTPPDLSEEEEEDGRPYTPEGSPPRTPKRHKGPRTPSPSRYTSSSRRRSHHKRRSKRSKAKGPRTPSPLRRSSIRSHSSSKSSRSPTKSSNSPSPHSWRRKSHTSSAIVPANPLSTGETVPESSPTTEEQLTLGGGSAMSQVAISGSNSPTLKSDIPKPLSPSRSPSYSPPSPQLSSPEELSPLDLSFVSNASTTEHPPEEPTPPPRKRHRGEGKVKSKASKAKDQYRHKLSKVVTHCLDQHRKSDCKYGRITCADDFKYLARKLTYGLAEKEFSRKSGVGAGKLDLTDSVKAKVKDYIRQYMKKFGTVYYRTSSP